MENDRHRVRLIWKVCDKCGVGEYHWPETEEGYCTNCVLTKRK